MMTSTQNKYKPFTIAVWNACNIKSKIPELTNFVYKHKLDAVLVTETHATPSTKIKIPNYTTYRKDRLHHRGGGVAIIINNRISTVELYQ